MPSLAHPGLLGSPGPRFRVSPPTGRRGPRTCLPPSGDFLSCIFCFEWCASRLHSRCEALSAQPKGPSPICSSVSLYSYVSRAVDIDHCAQHTIGKKTVRDIKAAIQVSVKAVGAKKPISKKTFKKVFAMLADEAEAEASQCSGNTRISHVPFCSSDPNKVNLAPEGLGRNPTGPKTPTASITPTRPVYYCRNTRGHLGGS